MYSLLGYTLNLLFVSKGYSMKNIKTEQKMFSFHSVSSPYDFATRIKEAIAEKLAEIRDLSNTFEGEESFTL